MIQDFELAYSFKSVILRYFNAAGADLENQLGEKHFPETHLIPLTIFTALGLQQKITIYGDQFSTKDGTAIRDYVHIQDLADAHVKALFHLLNKEESLTLNLGTSKGYTVREVIQKVEEKTSSKIPVEILKKRKGEPAILIANSQKANALLNWQPRYSELDTIIETALNWHKSQLKSEKMTMSS